MHAAAELTPLELATGLVFGSAPDFTVAPDASELTVHAELAPVPAP